MKDTSRTQCYDEALARFHRWITSHFKSDGSLGDDSLTCNAYMPLPFYARVTGQQDLAERVLCQIERRFIHNGELIQSSNRASILPYTPSWILIGAEGSGNLTVKRTLTDYVLKFQDAKTGGFFGSDTARVAGAGDIDFDSTAQACAALSLTGSKSAAQRAGQYLTQLVAAQPDIERRFFFGWHTKKGLVRDFEPSQASSHVIRWDQPRQNLYKIGLLTRAFALLREARLVSEAEAQYHRALTRSRDPWTNTLAHKMGWAASTLFQVTRKPRYAGDARRFADHLLTIQQPDGWFHYPEFWPSPEKVTLEQKLNIGAQFAAWIALAKTVSTEQTK